MNDSELGEPVLRLLRQVGGERTAEERSFLRLVSVHDMSVIHTQLEYQRIPPAKLWEQLKKTLAARKRKMDLLTEYLTHKLSELEQIRQTKEEAYKEKCSTMILKQNTSREEVEKKRRALYRDRDDFTEVEYEEKQDALLKEKADVEEEAKARQEEMDRDYSIFCRDTTKEIDSIRKQLEDASGPKETHRLLWEQYAKRLVSESAAAASSAQPEWSEFAPLFSQERDDIVLPSFTPKCENCGSKFEKPPPDWLCPTCLSKKHRQRVWQLENDSIRCMVCTEAPIARFSRHHCRNCGRLVCSRCCSHRVVLTEIGYKGPEKVCDDCYNRGLSAPRGSI